MVLYPEGAIRLQGTGRDILERCDGQRTLQQIVTDLQRQYGSADPTRIELEVSRFLEQMNQKRVVDY
jgi:pyrroloquinoline quinone biosynthesis protein D